LRDRTTGHYIKGIIEQNSVEEINTVKKLTSSSGDGIAKCRNRGQYCDDS